MATTKVDFKRELRGLYTPTRTPIVVEVPELAFLMIDGHGDPNTSSAYGEAVSALFSVSYAARFALKRAGVIDYGVMPLEGLWWVPDMTTFSVEDKSAWDWTMMIMQPDQVSLEVVEQGRASAAAKTPSAALERLRLERFAEGLAAQVLHVGPYSAEGPTIAALHEFIAARGCERAGKHHEIYLGDPRRVGTGEAQDGPAPADAPLMDARDLTRQFGPGAGRGRTGGSSPPRTSRWADPAGRCSCGCGRSPIRSGSRASRADPHVASHRGRRLGGGSGPARRPRSRRMPAPRRSGRCTRTSRPGRSGTPRQSG